MLTVDAMVDYVFGAMARSLPAGAALAAGAWLVMRYEPVRRAIPAAARHAVWLLVCVRLLVGLILLPAISITIPAGVRAPNLPAIAPIARRLVAPLAVSGRRRSPPVALSHGVPLVAQSAGIRPDGVGESGNKAADAVGVSALSEPASRVTPIRVLSDARSIAALIWLFGMGIVLLAMLVDAIRLVRVARSSAAVAPKDALGLQLSALAAGMRVGVPRLAVSDEIDTPLVLGPIRPLIIVPARCVRTLDCDQMRAVLAHEVAHVRRGDLFTSLLPALCRCVLWFFPVAWIAAAECFAGAEEACDIEAARIACVPANGYAETLIRLASSRGRAGAFGSAAVSPAYRSLRRRIVSLTAESRRRPAARYAVAGLAAVAAAALFVPAYAFVSRAESLLVREGAPSRYEITDLGADIVGRTAAVSIGSDGSVGGYSEQPSVRPHARAYVWRDGKAQPIESAPGYRFARALGLDSDGRVLVSAYNWEDWQHAAIAGPAGAARLLPTPAAYRYSQAVAIDDGGVAVGFVYRSRRDGLLASHAAVWRLGSDGSETELEELGAIGGRYSAASAIAADGTIVGKAETASLLTHACAWTGSQTIDLGALADGADSAASAVNGRGEIAGYSELAPENAGQFGTVVHATLWPKAGADPIDLGGLFDSGVSKARAIGDSGLVVGVSTRAGGVDPHATAWLGGRAYDLNALTNRCAAQGWKLCYAVAINRSGQIVGVGRRDGKTRAFLLTPVASGAAVPRH